MKQKPNKPHFNFFMSIFIILWSMELSVFQIFCLKKTPIQSDITHSKWNIILIPKALKLWIKGSRWSLTSEHLLYLLTFQNDIHSVTCHFKIFCLKQASAMHCKHRALNFDPTWFKTPLRPAGWTQFFQML